jgi:anti-sigma factor RsiW
MSVEPNQEAEELITRFLSGQLSEEERNAVEERFLADDDYFAQLLVMEDALVDDYVLGRLTDEERKNAELLFQSSLIEKREVKFTEDLVASLRRAREAKEDRQKQKKKRAAETGEIVVPKTSPWLQSQVSLSLIASGLRGLPKALSATAGLIVLLFVGGAIYFVFQNQRHTRELLAQRAALERTVQDAREKLEKEMQDASELAKRLDLENKMRAQAEEALALLRNRETRSVASLVLLPTIFERGGGSKTVSLNANATLLKLLLEVPRTPPYPTYHVLIKTFDGHEVWSRASIPASQIKQNKLSFVLSSSLFPYNDYRIELLGVSENGDSQVVADYAFKVRK